MSVQTKIISEFGPFHLNPAEHKYTCPEGGANCRKISITLIDQVVMKITDSRGGKRL
jgi:hypothetical protein